MRSQALYEKRYADEPFVSLARGAARGSATLRDTNECHVHAPVRNGARIVAIAAIDNLWKGASGEADPEPQLDARPSTRQEGLL